MSKIITFKLRMSDTETLVGALTMMGFPHDVINVGGCTYPRFKDTPRVDVLIQQKVLNGYGALGFAVGEDETTVYIDDMDDYSAIPRYLKQQGGADIKSLQKDIPQWYAAFGSMQALESEGLYPEWEMQKDGRIRIHAN